MRPATRPSDGAQPPTPAPARVEEVSAIGLELPVMAAVAAAITAERVGPRGAWIARGTGVVAVAAGAVQEVRGMGW